MKYRLTPGNGLFLFVLGIILYYQVNGGDAWDKLAMSYLFFYSVFILIGDFFLQFFISRYKIVLLIELITLPVIIFLCVLG